MFLIKFLLALFIFNCINAEEQPLSMISQSFDKFAFNLYNEIAKNKDVNVIYSPYSIATALSMVLIGATGDTEKQLRSLLNYENLSNQLIKSENERLITYFNGLNSQNLTLNIANKLYTKSGFQINPEFVENLKNYFKSEIELLNFNEPQLAASKINDWVSMKTNGMIKDLIRADALNALTRLVLINAIYFKSNWMYQFDKALTRNEKFHLDDGTKKDVQLMHIPRGSFKFRMNPFDIKANVCEFPYAGNSIVMAIILPHQGVKLSEIENKLDLSKLMNELSVDIEPRLVDVYVPRFKAEQEFQLQDVLPKMNAPDAFNPQTASFKGISTREQLYISNVVHKAVIEVSEEGTKAAAATGVVITRMSASIGGPMIPVFRADRPFIYLICDKKYNTILFAGKYVK